MTRLFARCSLVVAVALAPFIWSTHQSAAQDAKNTLRVAMYARAVPRGDTYGIQYIFPGNYWWEAIFDSFVRIDDAGQVLPHAATSWEVVNDTTWRVTFRTDLEFSNGSRNTADNVVKIFDFLTSDKGESAGIMRNFKLASYKAVGPQTIEFITQKPDPLLVPKLAAFYLADMTARADMGPADFAVHPVASGPYRVGSWTDQEMTATVNETSWRPGKVANLRITVVPEPAGRVAALLSGEVDISVNLGPDDIARIRAAGHTAVVDRAPQVVAFALFTEDFANKWNMGGKTPFSDRRVRQAANYAVNREQIIKELYLGTTTLASQPATPSVFGYNANVSPYPYDPAKARSLLVEAGYPDGFSTTMETTINSASRDLLQVVAADLAKVGIKIDVQVVPFSEWSKKFNGKSWQGDMTSFPFFHSPAMDASIPFSLYNCTDPRKFSCVPELSSLIEDSNSEMDRDKRLVLLQELMKKSSEEALALMLMNGADINGVASRVKGFANWNRVFLYERLSIE